MIIREKINYIILMMLSSLPLVSKANQPIGTVSIYLNPNFDGLVQRVEINSLDYTFSIDDLSAVGYNDQISSIKIEGAVEVKAYTGGYQTGTEYLITQDVKSLTVDNNTFSSIYIKPSKYEMSGRTVNFYPSTCVYHGSINAGTPQCFYTDFVRPTTTNIHLDKSNSVRVRPVCHAHPYKSSNDHVRLINLWASDNNAEAPDYSETSPIKGLIEIPDLSKVGLKDKLKVIETSVEKKN